MDNDEDTLAENLARAEAYYQQVLDLAWIGRRYFECAALTGLARISKNFTINGLAAVYIEFIRGTPLLVQIFIAYFFVGTVFNLSRNVAGVGALALFADIPARRRMQQPPVCSVLIIVPSPPRGFQTCRACGFP